MITKIRSKALAITLFSALALASGCDKEKTTAEKITEVQTQTKETAQDMKNYSYAQKAEFVKQMQSEVDALNKNLDQLSAKIDSSSDAVKAEAKPKLQALRDQAVQLNKQLDAAQNATESTWDSVKDSSKKAYESLKDGFNQSRQWVSDKIAP